MAPASKPSRSSTSRQAPSRGAAPSGAKKATPSGTKKVAQGRKPAAPRGAAPKPLPGKSIAATKAIQGAEQKARAAKAASARKTDLASKASKSAAAKPAGATKTKPTTNRTTSTGGTRKGASASSGRGGNTPVTKSAPQREHPGRFQRRKRTEAVEELTRLSGKHSRRVLNLLQEASEAYAAGRERDALRLVRPLVESYPDAMSVRELAGLCYYRIGNFKTAIRELEAFIELGGSTEQHPVMMDCYRALKQWNEIDECWRELAEASPSAEMVTEGRIVLAGALADRGRLDEAITLLEKRSANAPRKVQTFHARLWYALGDLHERSGNIPRARSLFQQVAKYDAQFADVAERLSHLR